MTAPRHLTPDEARRLHEMLDELEAKIGGLTAAIAELKSRPAERVVVRAAGNGHAAAEIPGWEER